MIDIHTHILPYIDDGSSSLNDSLEMVINEISSGVNHIFCTPHALRIDIHPYTLEELIQNFEEFKKKVEEIYPLVKLYLGQEIYVRDDIITILRKKQVLTMNNTSYILLELSYEEETTNLEEVLYACEILGLKVILAHVERYSYLSIENIEKLSKKGILMQVNSNSIIAEAKSLRNKMNKLFKSNLISFVGSDVHSFRKNTMQQAYEFVLKKYGKIHADNIFYNNAKRVLNIS